ncbi:peptide-methionine (S)-S-oxide reductase MsrA [Macrococcoides caseolyticum]|uniref:peptide-methionine (S)-S-oxide reductase MsrA n=1 Tax=Macrococcoides caseolyticum TaxID=69966 RepID=UPI001F22AE06|nr:peptide-methionine (S)-S-oxide reductase MsrA [Macrococcus caseolyticus]MCE4957020.1 peptide-methionine (S)-S-oxide reductase MsrA [Macrococcus caseolyticus]
MSIATLAGGCFWCMVKPFHQFEGVKSVVSGYSGGHVENPTYEAVCSNTTGHREAIQIEFDPKVLSYESLLKIYFKTFNPTDNTGQFYDRGESYTPAIFVHDDEQERIAHQVIQALNQQNIFNQPINTPIIPYKNFYKAENYHQDFYKKDPAHYEAYQSRSGRKAFINEHWGDSTC